MNKSKSTTPKSYRLKQSTHDMIKEIQAELQSTQDYVISRALELLSNRLKNRTIIVKVNNINNNLNRGKNNDKI